MNNIEKKNSTGKKRKIKSRHSYSGVISLKNNGKESYFTSKYEEKKNLKRNHSNVELNSKNQKKSRISHTGKRKKKSMSSLLLEDEKAKKKKKLTRYGQIKKKLEFNNPGYNTNKMKRTSVNGEKKIIKKKEESLSRLHFRSNSFDNGYVKIHFNKIP